MTTSTVTEKRCARCREVKPAADFYADRRASDGLQSRCKPCHLAYGRESKAAATAARPRTCIYCGQDKPGSEFDRVGTSTRGIGSWFLAYCRACGEAGAEPRATPTRATAPAD